jgi:hypothetical protein
VFFAVFCNLLGAQVPSSNPSSGVSVQPLLRIERIQAGESKCALVREDGTYRLENSFSAKNDNYIGATNGQQIDLLRGILANAELKKLSQKDVKNKSLLDDIDIIDIAIWRDRGWQTLSFHDSSSRKPYKDELGPLLSWFQGLEKKKPQSTKVDEPTTRCLPPKQLQAETQAPEMRVRFERSYLFWFDSRQSGGGLTESACTIVFRDGTYRREKHSRSAAGYKSDRGYHGQLSEDSVRELKELLDDPDLKNAVSDVGHPQLASNTENTSLFVPREEGTQILRVASTFNTIGDPIEPGGKNNLTYHVGNRKALRPLNQWMNQHTNKREGDTGEDKTVNNCSSVKPR